MEEHEWLIYCMKFSIDVLSRRLALFVDMVIATCFVGDPQPVQKWCHVSLHHVHVSVQFDRPGSMLTFWYTSPVLRLGLCPCSILYLPKL